MARFKVSVAGEQIFVDTHEVPHFDEILSIWLIEKFGTLEFLNRYAPNRILELGIGGGFFDEHPRPGNQKKDGECSATLVAKALGVKDEPPLEQLLRYALVRDTKGGTHPLELEALVKLRHRQHPNDLEKVVEWTKEVIQDVYADQFQFWFTVRAEFEQAAQIEEVWIGKRKLRLVTVVSDSPQMQKFARSPHGGCAAIVIQQQTSGNVQIFTDKRCRIDLRDVVRMIRLEEQKAADEIVTTEWKELEAEGKVKGAEEWYYHLEGRMLLNGSLTAPNVPPTHLSLKRIKELVRIGVNPELFESSWAHWCQQGFCPASKRKPCLWYRWGLVRCRRIRYQTRVQPNTR